MKKKYIPLLLALAIANSYVEQTFQYSYNSNGTISSVDGPRKDVKDITYYNYNSKGQLQTITNPLGQSVHLSNFDAMGNPQTITDVNGITTTLTYNERGLITSITQGNAITAFAYDKSGQLIQLTFPDKSYLQYTWDSAKRLIKITNNLNESINYSYDAMGNSTQEVIKKGTIITQQIKRQFDELGRLTKIIGNAGQVYEYTYAAHNSPISKKDGKGNIIQYLYDYGNRLAQDRFTIGNSTYSTQHNYDIFDNVTRLADLNSNSTWYSYDELNQLTAEDNRSAKGLTQYKYDEAGNIIHKIDASKNITEYHYDILNRLIKQLYPANTALNVAYQYDQLATGYYNIGQLTSIQDQGGNTTYNYNNQGLLAQENHQFKLDNKPLGTTHTINYSYDTTGHNTNIDFGTLNLSYSFDKVGKVTAITSTQSGIKTTIASNITYQPFGSLIGLTWGNGLKLTRTYDLDNQLTKQQIDTVTTQYQYDLNSNIIQINDSQFGLMQYDYDQFNRLVKEQGATTTTYNYDPNGGRTLRQNDKGTQRFYFAEGNRIYDTYGVYYKADAMNNILGYKDNSINYRYDENNRFVEVNKTQGNTNTTLARYIHNAYGERVIKVKHDDSISTFMYNAEGQLINETQYNATQQKQKEIYWIWLDTMPIAQIEISFVNGVAGKQTIFYIHSDHLNTPRWATNQAKQKIWTWQSDAYGNTLANEDPQHTGTKTTIPLRFPGQYFDQETGLHYNNQRTYHPDLGRYTQSDPIGLEGGWNTFTYVAGNPLRWSDALGLLCFDFDKFTNQIDQNRIGGTANALGVYGSTLAWGAMPKTSSEIGSLGGKKNMSPYTNQVSRWTHRFDLNRGGRSFMAGNVGKALSATTTGLLVFEGFYDWTVIMKSAWDATKFDKNCGCE